MSVLFSAPANSTETSGKYPVIDEDCFAIYWDGHKVRLGNTDQFRLACHLIRSRGRAVSHEDIRDLQDKPDMSAEAIRQSVTNLRRKLPKDLAAHIESEHGYYRFDFRP